MESTNANPSSIKKSNVIIKEKELEIKENL
jgi:hypothetical protein